MPRPTSTVQSRDVPHDAIVDEILAALADYARHRGRRARRRHDAHAAPRRARASRSWSRSRSARAPTTSLIGRGLLGDARRSASPALRPGARVAIVTDETVARPASRRRRGSARRPPASSASPIVVPPGEGIEELRRRFEQRLRRAARGADRARRPRRRARRRRGRRSRRLCRRGRAARPRLRAGADDAAGAGRFLGRRQDRHQLAATARTWSARSISRSWCSPTPALLDTLPPREFRAGYAEVAKYGLLGDAGFFAWLEANWRDDVRRRAGARARDRGELPRQGRRSSRATSARPASARCSISATPSATRSRRRPASPTGCCTARRSRSAWRWRSSSRRGSGLIAAADAERARRATLRRSACRPISRTSPAACRTPTR